MNPGMKDTRSADWKLACYNKKVVLSKNEKIAHSNSQMLNNSS
jgi:hypothetical protein